MKTFHTVKLLESKEKLLKLQGNGTEPVYNDDGNPHQVCVTVHLGRRGPTDAQRAKGEEEGKRAADKDEDEGSVQADLVPYKQPDDVDQLSEESSPATERPSKALK